MVAPYPASPAAVPAVGGDPTAVFGRRIVAFLIDTLLIAVPGVALMSSRFESFDASSSGLTGTEFCDRYLDQNVSGACFNLNDTVYFDDGGFDALGFAPLLLGLLIAVVLQGLTGWTPGKLVMGLRTVKEDGSAIGLGRAFVRWILLIVDGQPCGLPLVGLITAGTSTGHRRVGDMAAKSYVVRASAAGSPIMIPGTMSAAAPAAYGGGTWGQPAPTGWGQPAAPSPWDQPPTSPGGPAAAAPTAGSPQWDEARGTYIQWDASQGRWLQWDEASRTWGVIPGQ